MKERVEEAWAIYQQSIENGVAVVVSPSIPILFFRRLQALFRLKSTNHDGVGCESVERERAGTRTGLHGSQRPAMRTRTPRSPQTTFVRSPTIFASSPMILWFKPAFEEMLQGIGESSYDGARTPALVLLTYVRPLATDPTWSQLEK